jgi:hypothetical protein
MTTGIKNGFSRKSKLRKPVTVPGVTVFYFCTAPKFTQKPSNNFPFIWNWKLSFVKYVMLATSYVVKRANPASSKQHLYWNKQSKKTNQNTRYEVTNKCVEVVVQFTDAFQILPQHVSAIYCHHQGVVFTSESTPAICVVDVYGLQFVQCGQLSRDATTKSV